MEKETAKEIKKMLEILEDYSNGEMQEEKKDQIIGILAFLSGYVAKVLED